MLTRHEAPPRIREITESPAAQVERLEQRVETIRGELADLVGELERRRQRARKPLGLGVAGIAVLCLGGYVLWRILRARAA